MGVPYFSSRRKSELKEKIKELEDKNKKLEEEIRLLKEKLNKPVVVQPVQKVENIGNPKIIVNVPKLSAEICEAELYERPPIWSLLEPGVYFLYSTSVYSDVRYEILSKSEDYIKLKVEENYTKEVEEKHFFSTTSRTVRARNVHIYDVDRECRYKTHEFFHEENGKLIEHEKCEESGELELWIDPIGLRIGDSIESRGYITFKKIGKNKSKEVLDNLFKSFHLNNL